jgi:hypothetical protein
MGDLPPVWVGRFSEDLRIRVFRPLSFRFPTASNQQTAIHSIINVHIHVVFFVDLGLGYP